ncbi:MAG TPA: DUF2127 domain-containing protein [Chloroflexota bacterium]|jgi:uncharacterized membrane protein (DUF2068 family)|nr:DUF2127 domain-containing protein [Chloroflexota bacterium]
MTAQRRHGLWESLLADLHVRTEAPRGVVRLIIAYKAVSAMLLLAVALLLLGLIVNRDWGERVRMLVVLTGMRADNHLLRNGLLRFGLLGRRSTSALGVISLLYAMLETTEVVGLLNRRRWAEYLVLVATLLLLPYEFFELFRHVTVGKLLIVVVNVAIAVYFVKRKRLFQHPEEQELQDRTPVGAVS